MAVPRNGHSHSRKNKKRAHHAKKPKSMTECSNCGTHILPHRACSGCGHYKERVVFAVQEA